MNDAPDRAAACRVRDMRRDDYRLVSEVLGRAFQDDPVAQFLFPDDAARPRRYAAFARFVMGMLETEGRFLTTEPIWVPSIESSLASWSGVSGSTWSFVNRGLTDEFASFQDGKLTIIACGGLFPCTPGSPPSLPPAQRRRIWKNCA